LDNLKKNEELLLSRDTGMERKIGESEKKVEKLKQEVKENLERY
jgi:hypothetical protein